MPEAVIDMQFAHYLREFTDDEGFLHATYQAALQVERKKALKQAKEQMRGQTGNPGSGRTEKKEDKRQENRTSSKQKESHPRESPSNVATKPTWFGKKNTWPTMDEAMKGLPNNEKEEYRQSREDCCEGDREACPFEGAGAAADPYRKDPLSLSLKTSLL